MPVSEILEKLRNTTKRNEKIDILKSLSGQDEYMFKRVAVLTYSPHVNFWIKDIEYPESNDTNSLFTVPAATLSIDNALDTLENEVSRRGVTGHKARDLIIETYQALDDDEKDTFQCVVDRDLKSGVSKKTINKVWPDLVYDHPYMRASSFSKKNISNINFPCFSQTKEDGEYEDIIVLANNKIEQRARSGSINNDYLSNGVVNSLRKHIDYDIVLMGEIIAFEDNTRKQLMNRQKSNGYLNSNEVDPERLLHVIWDIVPYKDFKRGQCDIPYEDRMQTLKSVISKLTKDTDQIRIIDSRIVNSVDEVIKHFKENVGNDLEGVMVKNTNMKWKDGTSKDQVKVKIEFECDLKIVGFNQGKTLGKWDQKVGSIIYETADSKLQVNVGNGLSGEECVEIWNNKNKYMKMISTVKSNDVIASDSKPGTMSLFLPRVTKLVRNDKTQADNYDRVIEQKNAFVETLKAIENL